MSSKNEWPMVKLGEIAEIGTAQVKPESLDGETVYLGLEHLKKNGGILETSDVATAELKSSKYAFTEEAILFGKLRPNLRKIAVPNFSGVCSTDILPIYSSEKVNRSFLYHYLLSESPQAYIQNRVTGINLPRTSPKALRELQVPLPPLAEQQRIAEILDTISSNLASRKTQLEQLSTLQKSTFEQFHLAHLDQATKYHFKDVVPRIDSGKSPVCESRPAADNEWGVLKLSAVTTGEFLQDENKAYLEDTESLSHLEIQLGDLLMTRKNTPELVGAVSLVRETRPNLMLPDLIFRLNLNKDLVKPEYLAALLMSPPVRFSIRSLAGGSAKSMSNISKQRLNKLLIDLPPLNAQREFATKSQEIQAIKRKVNSAYKLDQELLASLQAHAFAGHL